MKNPCDSCLVSSCCSERCMEYATYVYETKDYEGAGDLVKRQIEKMPRNLAIEHIRKVENVYLFLDKLPD